MSTKISFSHAVIQRSEVREATDKYPKSFLCVLVADGAVWNITSEDTDLTKIPLNETVAFTADVLRLINSKGYVALKVTMVKASNEKAK